MGASGRPQVTPERISQMAWGYAPPLILEAAVRHHIFDLLAEQPRNVAELASAAGVSVRGVRAIANALVGLQLLSKDESGRFSLTPESATFLVSTAGAYMGGLIRHTSRMMIPLWMKLDDVVRTGGPAAGVNQQQPGSEFFHDFVEDLFPLSYPSAHQLAQALGIADTAKPVSVLDLAAGSGVWGIALAELSRRVKVTAVDWPGVLDVTRRIATRHGLASRYKFVAGDLLEADFGSGHQVATLGHILHSEGEARSRALLHKTLQALAPGGAIAIAEFLVDEDRTGPPMGLIFGVNMLVATDHGDTYSFGEISGWLREAGFESVRTLECPGPSPLILANRPA